MGVATSGREALEAARHDRPDVVLVDIGLPDQSGLAVGATILEERPQTILIAVTAMEDARARSAAARAGFRGFITKDTNLSTFVSSVGAALEGERVFQKTPRANGSADTESDLLSAQLTEREREVLALLAHGANGRKIADDLRIAPNTVRTHVQSILSKLQVHSRLEAAAFAVRHRLIGSNEDGTKRPSSRQSPRIPSDAFGVARLPHRTGEKRERDH